MCHLIFLLPVIGLVVFWIWPLTVAIPVYILILILSALFYMAVMNSMRRPAVTGFEELIGKSAEVIDMSGHKGHIRIENEIWDARSGDPLRKGDEARVIGAKDMTLVIAKKNQK